MRISDWSSDVCSSDLLGTQLTWGKITAKGIDFIADDGGLGAILNVQTIRLHEDSIRALLIKQVAASDVSQSVKERLVDKIKSMPADGIGTLTEKALEAGFKALPHVAPWHQALLSPPRRADAFTFCSCPAVSRVVKGWL